MRRTLLAILTVALVGVPATAHGARWTGEDAAGDAQAFSWDVRDWCPEPIESDATPGEDIAALTVRHGPRRVVTRLDYAAASVVPERRRTFTLDVRTREGDLEAYASWDGGRWRVRVGPELELAPVDHPDAEPGAACQTWVGEGAFRRCRHHDVRVGPRSVTVALPRACLGDPTWVAVGASSQATLPGGVVAGDVWGISGFPDDPNTEIYGARVRAPAPQKGSPSNRSRVTNSETSWRRSLVISRTGLPMGTTAATAWSDGMPSSS